MFAADHLRVLLAQQRYEIVAVYTQPDRPSGRGKKLTASVVKELAITHNIQVCQPASLKDSDAQQQLADLQADLMVVVAYGLILPKAVLAIPRLGCINVHASLLPRWRGAAPIQRAIEAGDKQTGVTIMQMDEGLDTGAMLRSELYDILHTDTGGLVQDKLAAIGGNALLATLDDIAAGNARPEQQDDSLAIYAHKITKQEALLDWGLPADQLDCKIRAFNPMPVAFTSIAEQRVRIWQAGIVLSDREAPPGTIISADTAGILIACGENALLLTEIQMPGKKRMTAGEVLQGRAELFSPGTRLGI